MAEFFDRWYPRMLTVADSGITPMYRDSWDALWYALLYMDADK
jgi:hypothetical protein